MAAAAVPSFDPQVRTIKIAPRFPANFPALGPAVAMRVSIRTRAACRRANRRMAGGAHPKTTRTR